VGMVVVRGVVRGNVNARGRRSIAGKNSLLAGACSIE
jgi:hypothetical protein